MSQHLIPLMITEVQQVTQLTTAVQQGQCVIVCPTGASGT